MLIQYKLDEKQCERLDEWLEQQNQAVLEKQKKSMSDEEFKHLTMNGKYPYSGAIGGAVTYILTHTSLGSIIKVQHGFTNEVLDLTNYDEW